MQLKEAKLAPPSILPDPALLARISGAARLLPHLVFHRGLHHPDDSLTRPLENTLAAYERAWAMGNAHHCECDVALTKDEQIVLAHDDTLARLARRDDSALSKRSVTELTAAQVASIAYKDGSRAPLLSDVLESADRVGSASQLVVEIKGNSPACARKLAELVAASPRLAAHISVVMGFFPDAVHAFAAACKSKGGILVMLLTQSTRRRERPSDPALDLDDPSKLEALLTRPGSTLDGLYLEFEPGLLTHPQVEALARRRPVGVWGYAGQDPDNEGTAHALVAKGVRFVNTDLPGDFFGALAT